MSTIYTYIGHGTHLLETNGTLILIDPYLDDNPASTMKAADVDPDYIFVSHAHGDHVADLIPIAERTGVTVIANAEMSRYYSDKGLKTHAQHIGGGHHHPFGYLKMTYAQHGSGFPDGSYGGTSSGMLLTTKDDKNIYLACDTGLFSDMQLIGAAGLDLAVIPIGDNFTMGPDDALKAVNYLQPKHVVPCHYDTWPVVEQDAEAWAERVRAETDAEPHVLQPGETLTV